MSTIAPDAYERLVDRLLASPRYGERMAADWLDVARFADTHGYQMDRYRAMWPYRDWVIKAFNQNLPFDQFVTWQLAGDLLPERDEGTAAGHRVQPPAHAERGRRRRRGGIPRQLRRRSRQHVRHGVPRTDL